MGSLRETAKPDIRKMKIFTCLLLPALVVGQAKRSKIYFEVAADGVPLGRINMELFNEVVPRTAENFPRLVVHGQRWTRHQRVPVFHHHSEDRLAGWEACGVRQAGRPTEL